MSERTRRWLAMGFGALVSAGILAWLASLVDWRAFAARLPPGVVTPLALSSGLYLGTLLLRALRFSWLFGRLAGARLSTAAAFDLVAVNNILNHLLPLRAGEIAFLSLARSRHRLELGVSAAVLVVARLGDLAGLLLCMSGFIFFVDVPEQARWIVPGLALVAVLSLLYVGACVRVGRRLLDALSGRFLPARLTEKVTRLLEKLDGVAQQLKSPWVALGNIFASALIWLFNTFFFQAVMAILGIDVTFAQVFIGGSGAALLPSLPINAFGSLGTLEAGWTAGFVLVGLEAEPASASGFVLHGVILLSSALAGAWALPRIMGALGGRRTTPPA